MPFHLGLKVTGQGKDRANAGPFLRSAGRRETIDNIWGVLMTTRDQSDLKNATGWGVQ